MLATMNPFDLRGPEFLGLYSLCVVVAVAGTLAVRWMVRLSPAQLAIAINRTPDLDPYEMAYLAGGPNRVLLLAAYSLLQRRLITLINRRILVIADTDDALHPVEQAILGTKTAIPMYEARRLLSAHFQLIRNTLQVQGYLINEESRLLVRRVLYSSMGLVIIMGLLKICVGISRDRPVGILGFLSMMTIALMIFLAKTLTHRTAAGDKIVSDVPQRTRRSRPTGTIDRQMMIAAWGLESLRNDLYYRSMRDTFGTTESSHMDSSGSSCSTSSCGSSGCGGGGGCGGCGGH